LSTIAGRAEDPRPEHTPQHPMQVEVTRLIPQPEAPSTPTRTGRKEKRSKAETGKTMATESRLQPGKIPITAPIRIKEGNQNKIL
ncbi:hypothetical protein KI387_033620, partial [Taxus chinensis]